MSSGSTCNTVNLFSTNDDSKSVDANGSNQFVIKQERNYVHILPGPSRPPIPATTYSTFRPRPAVVQPSVQSVKLLPKPQLHPVVFRNGVSKMMAPVAVPRLVAPGGPMGLRTKRRFTSLPTSADGARMQPQCEMKLHNIAAFLDSPMLRDLKTSMREDETLEKAVQMMSQMASSSRFLHDSLMKEHRTLEMNRFHENPKRPYLLPETEDQVVEIRHLEDEIDKAKKEAAKFRKRYLNLFTKMAPPKKS